MKPEQEDHLTEKEIERRRDAVLGRMAATKPTPHKPMSKSAADASPKKRGRSPKLLIASDK
jgi:hypothetical protein